MFNRLLIPELMDDPGIDPGAHALALRGLARLNAWSRAADTLWPIVLDAAARRPGDVGLLDVATGSGDIPVRLAQRAARAGVSLRVEACDVSESALRVAQHRARACGVALTTHHRDVLREELPGGFDLVVSSLFLHHLTRDEAVRVLRSMRRAAGAGGSVIISDLRRCRSGLVLAWAASRVLSRSSVVHSDAVQSVRAAWTDVELAELARDAGHPGPQIRRVWPFRTLLVCSAT